MKKMALVVALAVLVSGCAQVRSARDSAASATREANDIEAETWQMLTCNMSLGGLYRNVEEDLRKAALDYCLKEAAPE